jgi:hypothetical protein
MNFRHVTLLLLLLSFSTPSAAVEPRTFVVGLWPNRIALFDEATESVVGELRLRYGAVTGYGPAAHSPGFEKLYYVTDRMEAVEVVDPRKGEVVDELRLSTPGRRVRILSISPDPLGKLLYLRVSAVEVGIDRFENEDVQYVAYDLETHQPKESFRLPSGTDRYLMFVDLLLVSRDGSSLFVLGKDVQELRASDRSLLRTIVLSRAVEPGFGPLRIRGFLETEPGIYRGMYRTIDSAEREVTGVFRLDLESRAFERCDLGPGIQADVLALSPDGRYAYAGPKDLVKIDLQTERVVAIRKDFEQGRTNNTLIVSADGKKLYVTGVGDSLVVVDPDTLERQRTIPFGADITSPALPIPRVERP